MKSIELTLLLFTTVLLPEMKCEKLEIVDAANHKRFFMCDPKCVLEKCSDADDDLVCAHIIEVDPDGFLAQFPSTCAFNCANRCYENQLDISQKGQCKQPSEINTNQVSEYYEDEDPDENAPVNPEWVEPEP